mmetsp:Transcript_36605/g.84930  ORF Transcript_36605/g.84930 Transcript_36605/m.84930 type:complete len:276 (-) Transcript_36605:875-1702(-)
MGRARRAGRHRLARPGAQRPRFRRLRRRPQPPLARDLPRHPGPRPVALGHRPGARVLPGLLRGAGRGPAGPARLAKAALGRHFHGWRHRHAGGGDAAARAHPPPSAQRQRPGARRTGAGPHPDLCRPASELCGRDRVGGLFPRDLRQLRRSFRHPVAPPDRDLAAPPARRPRDDALRPRAGGAVRAPPGRLSALECLGPARPARALPARRGLDAADRRDRPGHARTRPPRGGGPDPRLRPCPGAEHAGADRADRTLSFCGPLPVNARKPVLGLKA